MITTTMIMMMMMTTTTTTTAVTVMVIMISCIIAISCRLQFSVWIPELCEGWSPTPELLITETSLAGHLGLDRNAVQDCYSSSQPTCSKSMDWRKVSKKSRLVLSSKVLNEFSKEKSQRHAIPMVFLLSQGPKVPRSNGPTFFTSPRRGPAGWWKAAGRCVRRKGRAGDPHRRVLKSRGPKFPGWSSSLLS